MAALQSNNFSIRSRSNRAYTSDSPVRRIPLCRVYLNLRSLAWRFRRLNGWRWLIATAATKHLVWIPVVRRDVCSKLGRRPRLSSRHKSVCKTPVHLPRIVRVERIDSRGKVFALSIEVVCASEWSDRREGSSLGELVEGRVEGGVGWIWWEGIGWVPRV